MPSIYSFHPPHLHDAFAHNLKSLRKERFRSAAKFARLVGVDGRAYRRWERGETMPDVFTVTRICKCLGITPNDLLPDPGMTWGRKDPVAA